MTDFFSTNEGAYALVKNITKGSEYKTIVLVNKFVRLFLKTFIPDPYSEYGNLAIELFENYGQVTEKKDLSWLFKARNVPFSYIKSVIDKLGRNKILAINLLWKKRDDIPMWFIKENKRIISKFDVVTVSRSPDITPEYILETTNCPKKDSITWDISSVFKNKNIVTPQNFHFMVEELKKHTTLDTILRAYKLFSRTNHLL